MKNQENSVKSNTYSSKSNSIISEQSKNQISQVSSLVNQPELIPDKEGTKLAKYRIELIDDILRKAIELSNYLQKRKKPEARRSGEKNITARKAISKEKNELNGEIS